MKIRLCINWIDLKIKKISQEPTMTILILNTFRIDNQLT